MSHAVSIMDAEAIDRALRRIAHEILEHNPDPNHFALVGIPLRGVELAERLGEHIGQIEGHAPQLGSVDVSMHRDDLRIRKSFAGVHETRLPLHLEDQTLILVDDVLFTGRTCRAAMDAISSFGRPARIQLAVLLDRGHRELPIEAGFVGRKIHTTDNEIIELKLQETDGSDKVLLMERVGQDQ